MQRAKALGPRIQRAKAPRAAMQRAKAIGPRLVEPDLPISPYISLYLVEPDLPTSPYTSLYLVEPDLLPGRSREGRWVGEERHLAARVEQLGGATQHVERAVEQSLTAIPAHSAAP